LGGKKQVRERERKKEGWADLRGAGWDSAKKEKKMMKSFKQKNKVAEKNDKHRTWAIGKPRASFENEAGEEKNSRSDFGKGESAVNGQKVRTRSKRTGYPKWEGGKAFPAKRTSKKNGRNRGDEYVSSSKGA